MTEIRYKTCEVCEERHFSDQACEKCLKMSPFDRAHLIAFTKLNAGFDIDQVQEILRKQYKYKTREINFAIRQAVRDIG